MRNDSGFSVIREPTKTAPIPYYEPLLLSGKGRSLQRGRYALLFSLAGLTRFMGVGDVSIKGALLPLFTDYRDIDTGFWGLRILACVEAVVGLYLLLLAIASYVWTPFS